MTVASCLYIISLFIVRIQGHTMFTKVIQVRMFVPHIVLVHTTNVGQTYYNISVKCMYASPITNISFF